MHILSDFHDYYDFGQKYGHDNIYFNRKESEVVFKPYGEELDEFFKLYPFLQKSLRYGKTIDLHFHNYDNYEFVVIVAGKIFFGYRFHEKVKEYKFHEEYEISYLYDRDAIKEKMKSLKQSKDNTFGKDSFKAYKFREPISDYRELFISRNELITYISPLKYNSFIKVVHNPCLKNIEFYRAMHGHTLFQELDMMLGGIIAQKENEIVHIDDKYLMQQKGFDCYSFKKEPSKRKRKTCKLGEQNAN